MRTTTAKKDPVDLSHPKCIFCKIMANKLPASLVYEDDICRLVMDINPVRPGHILIIPKNHYKNIIDMNQDVAMHMMKLAHKTTAALTHESLQAQFPCHGANLLWNNGRAAWQTVMHAHLHVIPRRKGDSFGFVLGWFRHLLGLLGLYPTANRRELDKLAMLFKGALQNHAKAM